MAPGAAVAVGMVYAAELALAAGYLNETIVDRTRAILKSLNLSSGLPGGSLERTSRNYAPG